MPPKPSLPPEDMSTRHNRGVQLETTVRGLLHHRAVRRAHRIFDQEWETSVLPHLPLRHPFRLQRLDRRGIMLLIDQDSSQETVSLRMKVGIDPHHPDQIAVVVSTGNATEVVGFLSADAITVLRRAGEHKRLYEVKPLQLKGIESGKFEFQMELVRPDLRQCSSCGSLHTAEHVNCEECRKKRRRKNKTLEETAEQAPVPMQSAFLHLSREPELDLKSLES